MCFLCGTPKSKVFMLWNVFQNMKQSRLNYRSIWQMKNAHWMPYHRRLSWNSSVPTKTTTTFTFWLNLSTEWSCLMRSGLSVCLTLNRPCSTVLNFSTSLKPSTKNSLSTEISSPKTSWFVQTATWN